MMDRYPRLSGIGVKYVREIFAVEDTAGTLIVFFEASDKIPFDGWYLYHHHNGWGSVAKLNLTRWHDYKCMCARLVAQGIYTQKAPYLPLEQDSVRNVFQRYFGS